MYFRKIGKILLSVLLYLGTAYSSDGKLSDFGETGRDQDSNKIRDRYQTETYIDADKIENCYFIGIGHCFLIFWFKEKPKTVEKKL